MKSDPECLRLNRLQKSVQVFASAARILKLGRSRDEHGPCARITHIPPNQFSLRVVFVDSKP